MIFTSGTKTYFCLLLVALLTFSACADEQERGRKWSQGGNPHLHPLPIFHQPRAQGYQHGIPHSYHAWRQERSHVAVAWSQLLSTSFDRSGFDQFSFKVAPPQFSASLKLTHFSKII